MYRMLCKKDVLLYVVSGAGVIFILVNLNKTSTFTSRHGDFNHPASSQIYRKRWSTGLDDDVEAMELGEVEKLKSDGKKGKDDESLEKDGVDRQEMSEEEELKFLEKLLSQGKEVSQTTDKADDAKDLLTRDEKTEEQELTGRHHESTDDLEREELMLLEKLFRSNNVSNMKQDELRVNAKETLAPRKESKEHTGMTNRRNKAANSNLEPKYSDRYSNIRDNVKKTDAKIVHEKPKPTKQKDGEKKTKEHLSLQHPDKDLFQTKNKRTVEKETNSKGSPSSRTDTSDAIQVSTSLPVVNPHRFRFVLNAPDACKDSKVFLLCQVNSAPKYHKRRRRIRQTWGNRSNYPETEIRVLFFVGQPNLSTSAGRLTQEFLEVESKRYGDIIQEDFLDIYKDNLTHKGIGALKWISTYCNQSTYVLKTDDDMFVNMYTLLNHLQSLHKENYRRRLIMCYVYWHMQVNKADSVSGRFLPGGYYPKYCSAMGIVMSTDVAIAFYKVSPYVRFHPLDDVYIGGLLPEALNGTVKMTSWERTYCAEYEIGVYTHKTEWYKYAFTHTHDEELYTRTWKGLTEMVKTRTIPRPKLITPGHLADEYIPLSKLFPAPAASKSS